MPVTCLAVHVQHVQLWPRRRLLIRFFIVLISLVVSPAKSYEVFAQWCHTTQNEIRL